MIAKNTNLCQICNSEYAELVFANEEMFGYEGVFEYGLCGSCGCLQCLNPPESMSGYYPKNYYSFGLYKKTSTLKRLRRGFKRKLILTHPKIISPLIKIWLKEYAAFWIYRSIGITIDCKLLDVGAGAGEHVLELRQAGVENAIGIDLFIEKDVLYEERVLVKKASLSDLSGKFNLITFHHSFEHMPDQLGELRMATQLLAPEGKILIRIPTVSSDAFEQYREKWFQLDAPRHLVLHSHRSIKILAEKLGLHINRLWCDSSELQFIKSEEYKRGIKKEDLKDSKKNSIFTYEEIKRYKKMALEANKNLRGDQICVLLSR